jgi:DNA (cytosine-5)-methyltransferase 1
MKYNIASLFTGAGGLDLGFHKAGFHISWANEFDKTITPTLRHNFKDTVVDSRDVVQVASGDIPSVIGVIGGPPCQSWSEAGKGRGFKDIRGKVFLEYIRIIKDKKPLFFLAENVSGMLSSRHAESFAFLVSEFEKLGYYFTYKLLNAHDYGVPEDRKRVFFIGYHKSLGKGFKFPEPLSSNQHRVLKDAIWDLKDNALPALPKNKTNGDKLKVSNHEYMNGGFSTMYMSRNRVRGWDEPSFTIQAGGRHAPLHPQAPKMVKTGVDVQEFVAGSEHLYRRLSVREVARIQTFPDDYEFIYRDVSDGYKMIGNAVPVQLGEVIAKQIKQDIDDFYARGGTFSSPILEKTPQQSLFALAA